MFEDKKISRKLVIDAKRLNLRKGTGENRVFISIK
jgi:hypothetical protein